MNIVLARKRRTILKLQWTLAAAVLLGSTLCFLSCNRTRRPKEIKNELAAIHIIQAHYKPSPRLELLKPQMLGGSTWAVEKDASCLQKNAPCSLFRVRFIMTPKTNVNSGVKAEWFVDTASSNRRPLNSDAQKMFVEGVP